MHFQLLFFFLVLIPILGISIKIEDADPNLDKIKFFLWTRENPDRHDIIELTSSSIEDSHFNPSHPVIILAHGWNTHGKGMGEDYNPYFFEVGDYNIFSIDWSKLESWANYPTSAVRTRAVGEHAANLVKILDGFGVFDNIHVIGHSLGAHVAGFLAKRVHNMGLGKLKRVTGLDPAEPFFDLAGPDDRIDKSDAEFVDIIHTNSGMLWNGCLSMKRPIGHMDFYPAGGQHQPGCVEACIGAICMNITIEDLIKGGCSHERANSYFKESIVARGSHQFRGWRCVSWEDFQEGKCCNGEEVVMGQWADKRTEEGSYYFHVAEETPYALDANGNSIQCKK